MKLFKRERDRNTSNEAIAEKIAGTIITKHRQLANYLNSKSDGVSRNAVFYSIIGFCVAFGGYCTYLIFDAINN